MEWPHTTTMTPFRVFKCESRQLYGQKCTLRAVKSLRFFFSRTGQMVKKSLMTGIINMSASIILHGLCTGEMALRPAFCLHLSGGIDQVPLLGRSREPDPVKGRSQFGSRERVLNCSPSRVRLMRPTRALHHPISCWPVQHHICKES